MARVALTLLTADRDGISVADAALTAAIADGHSFVNDGRTVLLLQNTNAATRTITVQTPVTVDGLAVAELTITLPATTGRIITATFPRTVYNQSDGSVYIDYSATAGVLVAAIKIPKEMLL